MGAPHVTPQEIMEMHRLYAKPRNYAAVGREIDWSGSTVAKYVEMKGVPQNIRIVAETLSQKEV